MRYRCSRYIAGERFWKRKLRAPKWYKRPVGASLALGKASIFHPRSSAGGASSLVSRSSEFESAIQNGEAIVEGFM
ncbi:hypothetical protein NC651_021494 [Populus alba x Populus x berolinensis]|nr:hypothetical protein NC651_021494 [Populus alba x Populus x berolinensis]